MTNTISNTTGTYNLDYISQDQDAAGDESNAVDYWDYFTNAEIPWYERAVAGALLPVVAPLSLVGCSSEDFAPSDTYTYDESASNDSSASPNNTGVSTDNDSDGDPACTSANTAACDCDDTDPNVNHNSPEIPDNNVDDDCDGVIDAQYIDDISAPESVDGAWSRNTVCDDSEVYQSYSAFGTTQYIPLAVHVVRNSDGSDGISDLDAIDDNIALVNSYFDDLNVAFYINEEDEIRDSDYNHLDDDSEKSDLLNSSYASETGINVFIVDYYSSPYVLGASTFPGYEDQGIVMVTSAVDASNTALTHELGHYFNLYHTHQGYNDELVARTNCTSTSDFLCETEADPAPYWQNSDDEGCYYDSSTCEITSCGDDAAGTEYAPNIGDVMGYYPNECKDESFAVEQQQLMLCTMQEIRTELEFEDAPATTEDSVGCAASKYTSIQEALDEASDGATIEICDGTYHESPALNGKSITLTAKDGHDNVVIDADSGSAVISATYSASTTSTKTLTLSGLTLTGGSSTTGAGIQFLTSDAGAKVNLILNDCIIEDNTSTSSISSTVYALIGPNGGDITLNDVYLINNTQADYALQITGTEEDDDTALTLSGGEISGNTAGGIYASEIHEVNLSDVTVASNGEKGIYLHITPTATLDTVTVTDNSGGGMAFSIGDSISVANSTIADNTLDGADCSTLSNMSAGIVVHDNYSSDMLSVTIENSSITDNDASSCTRESLIAGGILVYAGTATVNNTEVLRNTANTGSNAGGVGLYTYGNFTAANSDFGTSSSSNNSPADVAPADDAEYNYGNNVSFSCDGVTDTCR